MFAAFLAAFAIPVPAWDDVGHKITAYIAWQRMTPDVREKVIKIFARHPKIRSFRRFTSRMVRKRRRPENLRSL